nr:unnamed protein product [Digitaria exilis]
MGDAAGQETTKAPRITATGGDGVSTRASVAPPVEEQQRRRRRVPPPAAAAGVAATATATTGGSPAEQRCRGEEEEDDEQVERFYTLLANIRALRGLYSAGDGPMGGGTADGRGRKRPAREAEEPWRPAFRMEDFVDGEEVAGGARCGAVTTKQGGAAGDGDGVARTPAAAMARAAGDAHEGDEVAEARGRKLGRRVAARG